MTIAHTLGFPRIGKDRELKKALEAYWKAQIDEAALEATGRSLRAEHWRLQRDAGLGMVAVGDFSFYDHMLDAAAMVGAVPARFGVSGAKVDFATYFAMARGSAGQPAMEMTKWFDTNYHYIVPELAPDMRFALRSDRLFEAAQEALDAGLVPKPVLVGPLTFLWLAKERGAEPGVTRLALLGRLLPVYVEILARLRAMGVAWVQVDEPALALDLPAPWIEALAPTYAALTGPHAPRLLLATYFDSVEPLRRELTALPVSGIHLDLVRAPGQLNAFLDDYPADKVLSAGVVDGRNVWRTDLGAALDLLETAKAVVGDRLWVGPSCSLMHAPIDLALESKLDPELRSWLAFAVQKLEELAVLAHAVRDGRAAESAAIAASHDAHERRVHSPRSNVPAVRERMAALGADDARRRSPFPARKAAQAARLSLPPFPTTTIGSFPQTAAIREARLLHRRGALDRAEYVRRMRAEIEDAVRRQEAIGLDVLVHGEAERNDMVEYFGEQLSGFAFTQAAWVQSYGSRYVKPPIIFGDVERVAPMTVEWIAYAQSLTDKPMKGMLTGPVTILQWSFVRDDQPRAATALQIALAIRDEAVDLERAGIRIIQIDEPAIREGLPLKRGDWGPYLDWAIRAFRVASSGVADATQVHTHMCYSEFNDIIDAIAQMDADVITIECSRSQMELLDAFRGFRYPNDIGPGVYDIHSPRIPDEDEMSALLDRAAQAIPPEQLWVNPDCGLKTRRWEEVTPALTHMVAAARRLRSRVPAKV